jgi:hypothetical protein
MYPDIRLNMAFLMSPEFAHLSIWYFLTYLLTYLLLTYLLLTYLLLTYLITPCSRVHDIDHVVNDEVIEPQL